jgi:ABC-type uncharacterized transport system ATPase subunit
MRTISTLAIAIAVMLSWSSAEATQIRTLLGGDLCLASDVAAPAASGNQVIIAKCDPKSRVQDWTIQIRGGEVILLSGVQDQGRDLCIDLSGGAIKDKGKVQIYGCNQSPAQIWNPGSGVVDSAKNSAVDVTFKSSLNNDFCMEVAGGAAAAGTKVQLFKCNGTAAQTWFTK